MEHSNASSVKRLNEGTGALFVIIIKIHFFKLKKVFGIYFTVYIEWKKNVESTERALQMAVKCQMNTGQPPEYLGFGEMLSFHCNSRHWET